MALTPPAALPKLACAAPSCQRQGLWGARGPKPIYIRRSAQPCLPSLLSRYSLGTSGVSGSIVVRISSQPCPRERFTAWMIALTYPNWNALQQARSISDKCTTKEKTLHACLIRPAKQPPSVRGQSVHTLTCTPSTRQGARTRGAGRALVVRVRRPVIRWPQQPSVSAKLHPQSRHGQSKQVGSQSRARAYA